MLRSSGHNKSDSMGFSGFFLFKGEKEHEIGWREGIGEGVGENMIKYTI